jgi:HK97 family phage major capsid protein
MTKAELEKLLQSVSELTETVKEHNVSGDRATIDYKELAKEVRAQQAELAEHQNPPVRRGEEVFGAEIPAPGQPVRRVREGKFAGADPMDVYLAYKMVKGLKQHGFGSGASEELEQTIQKTLTATGSGAGDEYVPTNLATNLWNDMHVAARIGQLLPTIPMPSDPFDVPLDWGNITWRKGSRGVATTASDPASAKSTFTSTEQLAEVNFDYTLNEDSAIAIMPTLRASLSREGAEQIDNFLMNADATNAATGNINLDDADPADDAYYLTEGQDGLRHLSIVDNTNQLVDAGGDALTDADMTNLLKKLGKYALDLEDAVIVPGVESYLAMLGLNNVVTVDKYGDQATMLKGELMKYRGIPVVPSAAVALTEADGKLSTTAASNTLGAIVAFARSQWAQGYRRELMIEIDRDIQKRVMLMVVSFRIAIAARGTRSTAKHAASIKNILVA